MMSKIRIIVEKTNWSLLATLSLLLGSILWVVSPSMCLALGEAKICYLVQLLASLCFVFNGFLNLLEAMALKIMASRFSGFFLHLYAGGIFEQGQLSLLQRINWWILTHSFFFFGAWGDLWSSVIDYMDRDTPGWDDYASMCDIISSTNWTLSACCDVMLWYWDMASRHHHRARIQFKLFPCFGPVLENKVYFFCFMGWGAWISVIGSLQYCAGAWLCYLSDDLATCWLPQVIAGITFIFEAIFTVWDYYRGIKYDRLFMEDFVDSIRIHTGQMQRSLSYRTQLEKEKLLTRSKPTILEKV